MNKLELLPLAGCTDQEIVKYKRHLTQRQNGKTPCPDLRRNYIKCNGRIETYLRDLAKAEKNDPRKKQEKKNAVLWALNLAQCYADHSAHIPEGYVTDKQIIHEEIFKAYLEGVNGVLPNLDLPDVQVRHFVWQPALEIFEAISDNGIPISWDSETFTKDLKNRLQGTYTNENFVPFFSQEDEIRAYPVEFIRSEQIRKVLRETIQENMLEHFPSMKKA